MPGTPTLAALSRARAKAVKARAASTAYQRAHRHTGLASATVDKRAASLKRAAEDATDVADAVERAVRAAVAAKRRDDLVAYEAGLQARLRSETKVRREEHRDAVPPVSLGGAGVPASGPSDNGR
jgi:hypothetical protein